MRWVMFACYINVWWHQNIYLEMPQIINVTLAMMSLPLHFCNRRSEARVQPQALLARLNIELDVCVCVWPTVYHLKSFAVMLVGRGVCVVAVAAWSSSSSTGNASKHWELTGTRCLRLPTGGFLLWNKSVSGGSSLPLHCLAIFSVLYLKLFFCSRFLIY